MERIRTIGLSRQGSITTTGGTADLVLPPNPYRKLATFVNDSDTKMYLARGEIGVPGAGIPLYPNGGSYEMDQFNLWVGAISVYCAAAGKNLSWSEDQ